MIRVLHIAGVLALMAACAVLVSWAERRPLAELHLQTVPDYPGAADRFRQNADGRQSLDWKATPLVVQAEALAAYLNPPQRADKPSAPGSRVEGSPRPPPIRPAGASVKFRLVGTSYYAGEPGRSMALIGELGSAGAERWVKEGAQVGHFVIEEIRHGAIVYRDGEKLREMAVERGMSMPSLGPSRGRVFNQGVIARQARA